MSLPSVESAPGAAPADLLVSPAADAAAGHSHGDISALLFELARAIRARRCLPAEDERCREAIQRAHDACRGNAARSGAFSLVVEDDGFRVAATGERIARDPAPALAQRCRDQSIESLDFASGIALDTFARVVDRLALAADAKDSDPGLPAAPDPALDEIIRPRAACTEGTASTGRDSTLDTLPCHFTEADPVDAECEAMRGQPMEPVASPRSGPPLETTAPTLRTDAKPGEGPLAASDPSTRATPSSDGLSVEDDGFALLEGLLRQSADPSADDEARARARKELVSRAAVAPLDVLVSRACSPDASTSIRASQILLQLGAPVVPELLDRIVAEKDERRRGALCGVLIVMGETATPVLIDAMNQSSDTRSLTAVWLAGEIQNAAAVPALARATDSSEGQLRREAARALAKLGHPDAIAALDVMLASGDPERVSLAAWCLAASPGAAALALLCERLRSATARADFTLAREIVHALARRGSTEVVPDLSVLFTKRSLLHRRPLRELKLAAVRALSKIPGAAAEQALRDAAECREAAVRDAAIGVLVRRAPGCPAAH